MYLLDRLCLLVLINCLCWFVDFVFELVFDFGFTGGFGWCLLLFWRG